MFAERERERKKRILHTVEFPGTPSTLRLQHKEQQALVLLCEEEQKDTHKMFVHALNFFGDLHITLLQERLGMRLNKPLSPSSLGRMTTP